MYKVCIVIYVLHRYITMHGSRNVKYFVLLTIHVDPTQFGFWYHAVLNWTHNIL
jgi:hypothetical protein